MARCEDFPCCGHENGCCPDFDEAGNQLNMKCTCGATIPLSSRSSLCPTCFREGVNDGLDETEYDGYPDDDDCDDDCDDCEGDCDGCDDDCDRDDFDDQY